VVPASSQGQNVGHKVHLPPLVHKDVAADSAKLIPPSLKYYGDSRRPSVDSTVSTVGSESDYNF
jgi:hypothetical protein